MKLPYYDIVKLMSHLLKHFNVNIYRQVDEFYVVP